jgi:hypothetical protein
MPEIKFNQIVTLEATSKLYDIKMNEKFKYVFNSALLFITAGIVGTLGSRWLTEKGYEAPFPRTYNFTPNGTEPTLQTEEVEVLSPSTPNIIEKSQGVRGIE